MSEAIRRPSTTLTSDATLAPLMSDLTVQELATCVSLPTSHPSTQATAKTLLELPTELQVKILEATIPERGVAIRLSQELPQNKYFAEMRKTMKYYKTTKPINWEPDWIVSLLLINKSLHAIAHDIIISHVHVFLGENLFGRTFDASWGEDLGGAGQLDFAACPDWIRENVRTVGINQTRTQRMMKTDIIDVTCFPKLKRLILGTHDLPRIFRNYQDIILHGRYRHIIPRCMMVLDALAGSGLVCNPRGDVLPAGTPPETALMVLLNAPPTDGPEWACTTWSRNIFTALKHEQGTMSVFRAMARDMLGYNRESIVGLKDETEVIVTMNHGLSQLGPYRHRETTGPILTGLDDGLKKQDAGQELGIARVKFYYPGDELCIGPAELKTCLQDTEAWEWAFHLIPEDVANEIVDL